MQLKGGLLFVDDSNPRPFKQDLNNIQPRIGATYQLDAEDGAPRRLRAQLPADVRHRPLERVQHLHDVRLVGRRRDHAVGTAAQPVPERAPQPVGSSQGLATLVGNGFTYQNNDRTIPYVHQFSIGVQRELPWQVVIDASYVGSRTRGYPVAKGINEISAAQLR